MAQLYLPRFSPRLSRRASLQALAALGLGIAAKPPLALAQEAVADEDIFQFALNLEYMEAEYYLLATTGKGIDAADLGSEPGPVKGGRQVAFELPAIAEFGTELAENELAHVRFYRRTLGDQAVSRPVRIVYLTDQAGVSSRGFYPQGMNGALKST